MMSCSSPSSFVVLLACCAASCSSDVAPKPAQPEPLERDNADASRVDTPASDAGETASDPPSTGDASVGATTSGSNGVTTSALGPLDHPDASSQSSEEDECAINAELVLSNTIGTVGIVTFTTELGAVDSGYVEFGLDESYGTQAPIDINVEGYRTLLWGTIPDTRYHYRVVARRGDITCVGADSTFTTGSAPVDLVKPTIEVVAPDMVAPGFFVSSSRAGIGSDAASYMFIYNTKGEPVWWYESSIPLITRSRISWDGKYIYGRDGNPNAYAGGKVVRIAVDGSEEEVLSIDTGHHDMAATPDNGMLFLTGGGGEGCSTITKLSADGTQSPFYDLRNAFGDAFRTGTDPCHCNSIDYNPEDKTISVSCLNQNAYVKLSEAADLLWVLGGNNGQSDFTGDIGWDSQHGHHFVAPNRVVFFNNRGGGDSEATSSLAVELELDFEQMTATRVWEFEAGFTSLTLGDVQRLENGNTLVTYSGAGVIYEITQAKEVVQTWTFPDGVGYSEHKSSLYPTSPRR